MSKTPSDYWIDYRGDILYVNLWCSEINIRKFEPEYQEKVRKLANHIFRYGNQEQDLMHIFLGMGVHIYNRYSNAYNMSVYASLRNVKELIEVFADEELKTKIMRKAFEYV